MTDELPLTYREYQVAHTELVARVVKVETEQALMRSDFEKKLDINTTAINNLRIEMLQYRQAVQGRIIGWLISFVVGGGGMVGILQAFHLLR